MLNINNLIIVGSEEWCQFPDLNIPGIKARVDSGAKTSSLHAFNIQSFRKNGEKWVNFEVHPLRNDNRTSVFCEAKVIDQRVIKSSSGSSEKRFVIRSKVLLGSEQYDIELTLTNRDSMGYRMLLGREAMEGRVLVNPAVSFSLGDRTPDDLNRVYQKANRVGNGLKVGVLASNPDL